MSTSSNDVAAPPHIWKLTDRDGDGIAETHTAWWDGQTLTGCANDVHGPYLGPDGWFYWTKGAFAEQKHTLGTGKPFVTRAALTPYDVAARRGELKHLLVTASPDGELMVRFVVRSTEPVARVRKHLPWLLEQLPVAVASVNLQPEHKAVLEGEDRKSVV